MTSHMYLESREASNITYLCSQIGGMLIKELGVSPADLKVEIKRDFAELLTLRITKRVEGTSDVFMCNKHIPEEVLDGCYASQAMYIENLVAEITAAESLTKKADEAAKIIDPPVEETEEEEGWCIGN